MRQTRFYKFLIFFFLTVSVIPALGQVPKPFAINGKMSSAATGYVYLRYIDSKGIAHKDSSVLKNGLFTFKGMLTSPIAGYLGYKRSGTYVIIEPAIIAVNSASGGLEAAITSGTVTQQEDQLLRSAMNKIEKRWKVVIDTLNVVNKRSNTQFQELKGWVLVPYFAEQQEASYAFYDKYPSSYVTAYGMRVTGRDMTDDSLKMYYSRFSPAVKASVFGLDVSRQIAERKIGAVGSLSAGFNRADINGKTIDLAALHGQYVLLDFWGSWCVPCRKGNSHLREVYAEYKSKGLEIIGVAADDRTADAWRKAVAEDKLTWPQILQGDKPGEDLSKAYNIMYYPTKILIGKDGKIIGRYGEEHEALDKKLKELM